MTQHEMTKAEVAHPLAMLTADEIERAVAILSDSGRLPEGALFASIVLHEPAKDVLARWTRVCAAVMSAAGFLTY